MPDYKEMYCLLFDEITKAITALQEAQKKTEALYMAEEKENLLILPSLKNGKKKQPSGE